MPAVAHANVLGQLRERFNQTQVEQDGRAQVFNQATFDLDALVHMRHHTRNFFTNSRLDGRDA